MCRPHYHQSLVRLFPFSSSRIVTCCCLFSFHCKVSVQLTPDLHPDPWVASYMHPVNEMCGGHRGAYLEMTQIVEIECNHPQEHILKFYYDKILSYCKIEHTIDTKISRIIYIINLMHWLHDPKCIQSYCRTNSCRSKSGLHSILTVRAISGWSHSWDPAS